MISHLILFYEDEQPGQAEDRRGLRRPGRRSLGERRRGAGCRLLHRLTSISGGNGRSEGRRELVKGVFKSHPKSTEIESKWKNV